MKKIHTCLMYFQNNWPKKSGIEQGYYEEINALSILYQV